MKTFINKKSSNRYPEFGSGISFRVKEYFIRIGFPDCSHGSKKFKTKDWIQEEIPDLIKPFTDEQFREYAKQYGVFCAMQFLECCDYIKYSAAMDIIYPPEGQWDEVLYQKFQTIFGDNLKRYIEKLSYHFARKIVFDVIQFEKLLMEKHGYKPDTNQSMREFCEKKFGEKGMLVLTLLMN